MVRAAPALILVAAVAGATGADVASAANPSAKVTVPAVTEGLTVEDAYVRLHQAGLRVTVPTVISIGALCKPGPSRQSPRPGALVPRGRTVILTLGRCGLGSPAVPPRRPLPAFTVPDLVGQPVSAAAGWAARSQLYFSLKAPPLRRGNAATLFANYQVAEQHPAPGEALALGILVATPGNPDAGTFLPTPLRIRAITRVPAPSGAGRRCDPRPELKGELRVRGTTCSSARYVVCGFYFTERPVRHFVCRGIGTTWCERPGATIWFSGKLHEC